MNTLLALCAAAIAVPAIGLAYENAFAATPSGTIEIKTIPERTLIVAENAGGYFDGNNGLFGQLFRYIKDNNVSMTVPVKAEINPGKMYFYIGSKDLAKDLKQTDSVKIVVEPAHTVVSIGVRGGYSEKKLLRSPRRAVRLARRLEGMGRDRRRVCHLLERTLCPGLHETV